MHSIFSSLLPSYNGVTGAEKTAIRKFNQNIFTITDYFQLAGYETFRYDDADGPDCPMSGFKRWEGSGYYEGRTLRYTDLTKTERRDRFVEDVNVCAKSKFVYHHIALLHDLGAEMETFWSSKGYSDRVEITAKEFEKLYHEYLILEDDLVIISADHGVLLDMDFIDDCRKNVGRHYEQSVISFFSLIGKDIPVQVLSAPISALDEAPTLLHLALEETMPGQGKDQYCYIYDGEYKKSLLFRENIIYWCLPELANHMESDLYYLRDGKWKYVFSSKEPQCEWLIDLDSDQDYQVNRKDQYPELREKYHQMAKTILNGAVDFQYKSALGFDKADIQKEFSLILQIDHIQEETIESILDMSGPYHEVIMPYTEITAKFKANYKVCLTDTLDKISVLKHSRGEWLVYLSENGEYSEYFLSDLYRYIQHHRRTNVKIIGEHYTAIRKEEAENFEGVELYEKKQVRTIRFLRKTEPKTILFGCGANGKRAISLLGHSNVFCFADNAVAMVGKTILGKRVISFDELVQIHGNYQIVVTPTARSFAQEIGAQLERAGIYDYYLLEERFKENYATCWEDEFILVRPSEQILK